MNKKEYVISCTSNSEELYQFSQLLRMNGIDSEIKHDNIKEGQMGLEEILTVLITSAVVPAIISAINIWNQNRKLDITIIETKTKKEIKLKSDNGKSMSPELLKELKEFFED